MPRGEAVALSALLLMVALVPSAGADHCATAIAVYGRAAFAPGIVPPAAPRSNEGCVSVETSTSAGHVLLPNTDQILVRVEADMGSSYPLLPVRLEGLGFREQTYTLQRTQAITGAWTYNLRDWLELPDAGASGTLRVTVRFPGGNEVTTEYTLERLTSSPEPAAPPALP